MLPAILKQSNWMRISWSLGKGGRERGRDADEEERSELECLAEGVLLTMK